MYNCSFYETYSRLSRDPQQLRMRAKRALLKALFDPNAWSIDGNIPNRRWLLARLGFPEDLEKDKRTVGKYWQRLCSAEIINDEWKLKAALILAALGKDPFLWVQEKLWSGSSVSEIASEIRALLREREAIVSLTETPILTLVRYGFEKQVLTITPLLWEMALRESSAVKARVKDLMVRALNDKAYWREDNGNFKGYLFFEELGLPAKASAITKKKFRKRLEAIGAFPRICRYKVAFVLYALGLDPLAWVRANSPEICVDDRMRLEVNELLGKAGFQLRIRSARGFIEAMRTQRYHPDRKRDGYTDADFEAVVCGLKQAVIAALNDSRFWTGQGMFRKHMILRAATEQRLGYDQFTRVWEELLGRRVIPPTCNYSAGLVLWALGIDAISWVKENYTPDKLGSLLEITRMINGMLSEANYSFRLGGTSETMHRMIHYLICQGAL